MHYASVKKLPLTNQRTAFIYSPCERGAARETPRGGSPPHCAPTSAHACPPCPAGCPAPAAWPPAPSPLQAASWRAAAPHSSWCDSPVCWLASTSLSFRPMHMSLKFPAIVISFTGCFNSPFSIKKPVAPTE